MGSNPIGPTGSARFVAQLAVDSGQPPGPAHAGDGLGDLRDGGLQVEHRMCWVQPGGQRIQHHVPRVGTDRGDVAR